MKTWQQRADGNTTSGGATGVTITEAAAPGVASKRASAMGTRQREWPQRGVAATGGHGFQPCRTGPQMMWALAPAIFLVSLFAFAQDIPGRGRPSVTLQPPEIATIYRGHSGTVELQFRIASGFHINSNHPKQEYLKKTELKLDAPTDIVIEKVAYPDGKDRSFDFAPDEKLNVYSGDFAIAVKVRPLKSVLPVKYAIHGQLNYQACDNAVCYPPKQLPVSFEVKIAKSAGEHRRKNPPQSPHG